MRYIVWYMVLMLPSLPPGLRQFYTPWCEHSQAALPHFVAAVQHIVDHNMTGVSIGKLDISKESG